MRWAPASCTPTSATPTPPGQAEADQWTVGYNHHLSARTKLYAFYTVLQNRHGAHFAAEDLAAGEDRKSLSVGIRHHF